MTPTTWTATSSPPPPRQSRSRDNVIKQIFHNLPPLSEWHYLVLTFGALIAILYFSGGSWQRVTPLPIHVSMRQSALKSADGVLQIENRSDETLHLALVVNNLDNGQELKFRMAPLSPHGSVELGMLELGWTFEPNEEVTLLDLKAPEGTLRANKFLTFRTAEGAIGIRKR
jgi:hypothetical protein